MANTYNGVVPGPVLLVQQGDTRRHRLHERRRDCGLDPSARHARHSGRDGRRRRDLAAARPARRTLRLPVRRRYAGHVHLSHARRRGDARLGPLRRDHRAAVASATGRAGPRRRLPRDALVLADPKRRRESLYAQRQRVPGDARARRARGRALSRFAGSTSPAKSFTPCTRMGTISRSSHATRSRWTTATSKIRSDRARATRGRRRFAPMQSRERGWSTAT